MANNPRKNDIDHMMLERHLSGQTLSWMEGMSLQTPDVVEWTREKLAKLIAASKDVNAPDIRQPLTDIIIDTGVALIKLEKSQQKILGMTADEGSHVKKEAQKRLHKKAAKLLGSLALQLSELAYKLEHKGYEIQAQIGDALRESRNEGNRLDVVLAAPHNCEERLEILHEHMAASKNEEERQFISDVIDFVKTSQALSQEVPKLALTMLEMEAFKTTLEKDFLISIRNIQKLAGERANGWYL